MAENSIVERAATKMDEGIEDVMPDSWLGHARLVIAGRELSEKQSEFAVRLAEKLIEESTVTDAEKAGQIAVKKAKEKLD